MPKDLGSREEGSGGKDGDNISGETEGSFLFVVCLLLLLLLFRSEDCPKKFVVVLSMVGEDLVVLQCL